MEVILLEKINRLGSVGDTVKVRDGFARNFLLPQKKALRATEANKQVFEGKRAALEEQNAKARAAAEVQAKTMPNITVTVVRQASEDGKLYGSVTVRDVAEALADAGHKIERRLIDLNSGIKTLGVYEAVINLHAEVQVPVRVHVARNADSPLPTELLADAPAAPTAAAAEGEAA